MAVTPLDISNKEFPKKALGGYSKDAVDDYLDQIVGEMEHLIKENSRLKQQFEDLNLQLDQYRTLENTITQTLVVAQESAEDVKANAKKQADLIIQEARLQAERIIEGGQSKARRIMDENADLSRAAHTLRTQVRSILQAQLQAIEGLHEPFLQAAAGQLNKDGKEQRERD